MSRILSIIFAGTVASLYLFSFSFTFLPPSLNTKLLLALFGLAHFVVKSSARHELVLSKELVGAAIIAVLFSLWCMLSAEFNQTTDMSYANYFMTFFVWIFGAYTVGWAIFWVHGEFNIPRLTFYLAGASVVQCISALLIDNIPAVKSAVDSVIFQGADFLDGVGRLYGLGASLDSAGVRFSIVLILIAYTLVLEEKVRESKKQMIYLIASFLVIVVIGNMISRTTTTGALLGLAVIVLSTGIYKLVIKASSRRVIAVLSTLLVVFVSVGVLLYQTDPYYYDLLRYGFEGFFNWAETGEWSTGSTDKLNAVMWVWPTDFKTWMIGSGIFGLYAFSTDIGYCRFVLYVGLIGFGLFVLFFIYNTYVFVRKHDEYKYMFMTLLVLAFIIWLKVATDIFMIFALFYWLDEQLPQGPTEEEALLTEDSVV